MNYINIVSNGETIVSIDNKDLAESLVNTLIKFNITIGAVDVKLKSGETRRAKKITMNEYDIVKIGSGFIFLHLHKGTEIFIFTDI